jgi:hypothetical protein
LCEEVCPADVAIGDCLLEARKELLKRGGMPPAFHDYYLRDFEHATSEESYFKFIPGTPKYLFFPGCQTGASLPDYVIKPYEKIRAVCEKEEDAGILVTCCGAPAEWAGDEERAGECIRNIKDVWESAGRPVLVCSCLTCRNMLAERLPDIPTATFVEWLDSKEKEAEIEELPPGPEYYLFDPCAARYAGGACDAARSLLKKRGITYESGEMSGRLAECCGYGGHIYASNPDLYDEISKKRTQESGLPYMTYCSNCRDAFAAQGKECLFIYDALFGEKGFMAGGNGRPAPGISKRRLNRIEVKRRLEGICFGNDNAGFIDPDETAGPALPGITISDGLAAKMERELISSGDIIKIIGNAEDTDMKLSDTDSGHYIAHGPVGVSTCWVVYEKEDGAIRPVNIYTHRLRAADEV